MNSQKQLNLEKTSPLVSIVIPTYNAANFIKSALNSVLKTRYSNFEVIIVDDCSTDATVDLIKKNFHQKNLVVYKSKQKLLAAGSRNTGVNLAKGGLVALLDHDIEVDPFWIQEMLQVFENHPDAGTVQSRVLDIKKRNTIQHAGVKINAFLGWVIPVGYGLDHRKHYLIEERSFANATGLMFKKKMWKKLGGFDEMLAINTDDWDFNWRSYLYGYTHYLAPKALTYHWSKKQQSRDVWIKRFWWEFHFAKVPWIFIKNYSLKNIVLFLPVYLTVNFLRGLINLLIRFNPSPLMAFFASLAWVLVNCPKLLELRREVQKNRKIDDEFLLENIFDTNSPWGYFRLHWMQAFKVGKKISTETPY